MRLNMTLVLATVMAFACNSNVDDDLCVHTDDLDCESPFDDEDIDDEDVDDEEDTNENE